MPYEALRHDAWQLAVESGDNRLALAVDANAVEPEMEVAATGGTRASIAAETVCKVVAVKEVGLIAVPDVEKKERAIATVRDEASVGAQSLTDSRRQCVFDAAKQFERVWCKFVFAEHILEGANKRRTRHKISNRSKLRGRTSKLEIRFPCSQSEGTSDERLLFGVALGFGFLEIEVGFVIGMLGALRVIEQPVNRQ